MPTTAPAHRVAAEVRAELARQNRTRAELAAALSLSPAALQRRLAGQIPFDVVELDAVASFLAVPATQFLPAA